MLNGHAQDLMEARSAVECSTARLAAQRSTPAERQQLYVLTEEMARAGDLEQFIDLDIKFHLTLAQASQNIVLREIVTGIQQLMRGSMRQFLSVPAARARAVEQHRRLCLVIEQGAVDEAEQTMRAHLYKNAAFFGNRVEQS
jgi:GntR family L-lactate dehydrogenase operon transcriptional regulator